MRALAPIACLLVACRSPLPEPSGGEPGAAVLLVEPSAELSAVFPVSRIRIDDPAATGALVITGELSEYYIRKIRAGQPPNTLLERAVECASWVDEQGVWLSPVKPLGVGETYSVATEQHGLLGTLRVLDEAPPMLERRFPPVGAPSGPVALYCGEAPVALETETFFEPGHVPVETLFGVFGDPSFPECVSLRAASAVPNGTLLPPISLGNVSLDPAPLVVAPEAVPLVPVACNSDESQFDLGCVEVLDDRAIVRSLARPALWTLAGDISPMLETPEPNARFAIRGLVPESGYTLEVGLVDGEGNSRSSQQSFSTHPPLSHVVINEVLANPAGPEPAQEWIELVNDGTTAVELEGYLLVDASGESVFSKHLLGPGAFVLVARDDFMRNDGLDVPVPDSVPVLLLSSLGKNGLSNAGERLELRTPQNVSVSIFPALPKPKAGISVARQKTWSFDDDVSAFTYHAAPGASPGAPNQP